MLKTFTTIFFLLLLNGCIQNTAFLGPVITGASTGSIHQAALSYGSNKAIKKMNENSSIKNLANQ